MDEYTRTRHDAIDAAAAGDLQALYIARWMLDGLAQRSGHATGHLAEQSTHTRSRTRRMASSP